jgi:hypothetical protein
MKTQSDYLFITRTALSFILGIIFWEGGGVRAQLHKLDNPPSSPADP